MRTRGDVYAVRLGRATRGNERRGRRPCVIVQSSPVELATVVIAPMSRAGPATRLTPEVELDGGRSRVLVPQLRSIDHARVGEQLGRLSADELGDVDEALSLLLSLD